MKLTRLLSSSRFNKDKVVTTSEIHMKTDEWIPDSTGRLIEVKRFHESGLFSEKIFGSLTSEFEYGCECGALKGKEKIGIVCETCDTPVDTIQATIDKTGWIDLGEGKRIVKYVPYLLLEKVIGRDNLREIISSSSTVGIDGLLIPERFTRRVEEALSYGFIEEGEEDMIEDIIEHEPKQRYYNYSIKGFEENFYEILDYYHALNNYRHLDVYNMFRSEIDLPVRLTREDYLNGFYKDGEDEIPISEAYKNIKISENDEVFTQYIPVISAVLRPATRTKDGLRMDEMNKLYIAVLTSVQTLNDPVNDSEISQILTLAELQAQYFQLSQHIMDSIKSKQGLIRNQIAGTRINWSARSIISPNEPSRKVRGKDVPYKINEISLPYITFLNLYKPEIINYMVRTRKKEDDYTYTFFNAEEDWHRASIKFDENVYKIMLKMVQDGDVGVLINRNPTIAYGSILYVRIAHIKGDYEDMTMGISNSLLGLISGDYDGDVLNIIAIKDSGTREILERTFSPASLIIDKNHGGFNRTLAAERDQILGLNSLLL